METGERSVERKVILHNVRWETYERLLAEQESGSAPRFTYDRGELEIMSPSTEHEEYNRTIALLVEIFAVEAGLDVRNVGSITFRREDLERGWRSCVSNVPSTPPYRQASPYHRSRAPFSPISSVRARPRSAAPGYAKFGSGHRATPGRPA
jgi:hypothetical protein